MSKIVYTVLSFLILLASTATAQTDSDQKVHRLDEVVVTDTREEQSKYDTPATVGSVKSEELKKIRPSHPSAIMGRIPGVLVNKLGGEGHMTSIRQPITSGAVYLYLENGVPTRSTGFFNHNALYEVNVPMSRRIEVTKGSGSALYGSDAIGGIINVMTHKPPTALEMSIDAEGGSKGWKRILATAGTKVGDNGFRADFNITHSDGWRDSSGYDRQSASLTWKFQGKKSNLNTFLTYSNINQKRAGSLTWETLRAGATLNTIPISYRNVRAFRLSTAYEQPIGNEALLSVIPYLRWNEMDLLPSWMLSYDPVVYNSGHSSVGLLAKYRRNFDRYRSQLIAGIDLDYSPGHKFQEQIEPVKEKDPTYRDTLYTDYSKTGEVFYNYDATFRSISSYVHGEISPVDRLRLSAGLRFDLMGYDYQSKIGAELEGRHRRPEDTSIDYSHLSPKLGAIFSFSDALNIFASYRHAFRVPSEGQLFTQGSSANTVDLKPVKVDSYEIGIRGSRSIGNGIVLRYDISSYLMLKKDDILSLLLNDVRTYSNAGETSHKGQEFGCSLSSEIGLNLEIAYSISEYLYEKWEQRDSATGANIDYSGNEMKSSPRDLLNINLSYAPKFLEESDFGVEFVRRGSQWMDERNTLKYNGHNLVNITLDFPIGYGLKFFGRVTNLTDERYAENASRNWSKNWSNPSAGPVTKDSYTPGEPRTIYAGIKYDFKK